MAIVNECMVEYLQDKNEYIYMTYTVYIVYALVKGTLISIDFSTLNSFISCWHLEFHEEHVTSVEPFHMKVIL